MNQAMRQRALGILVLVALASILLPLLLDFRTGYRVDPSPTLPPAPDIQPKPLPQFDSAPAQSAADADAAATAPAEPAVPPLPDVQNALVEPGPAPAVAAPPSPPATKPRPRPQPEPAAQTPPKTRAPPFELPAAKPQTPASQVSSVPQEPGLDAQGMPRAWVLQLGVFSQEQNALELRNRLLAGGHRAFIQPAKAGQPRVYRVFVGPKMTRDQLAAEQRELERKFKIKPMVVPFAP